MLLKHKMIALLMAMVTVYFLAVMTYSISENSSIADSIWWAFMTFTTVGYGDFRCNVYSEYIISILWMLVGATFYSFLVSNISSLVASMD